MAILQKSSALGCFPDKPITFFPLPPLSDSFAGRWNTLFSLSSILASCATEESLDDAVTDSSTFAPVASASSSRISSGFSEITFVLLSWSVCVSGISQALLLVKRASVEQRKSTQEHELGALYKNSGCFTTGWTYADVVSFMCLLISKWVHVSTFHVFNVLCLELAERVKKHTQ